MKAIITLLISITTSLAIAQSISINTPETITCNLGITLNATITPPSNSKGGYQIESIPYNPPCVLGTGTQIAVTYDDAWSGLNQLPFGFKLFDSTYTSYCVGENGVVSFMSEYAGNEMPWDFPNPHLFPIQTLELKASIMACYNDLYIKNNNGGVYHTIIGTAPSRALCVSWKNAEIYEADSTLSVMAVMYESTNIIELYIEKAPIVNANYGRRACGIIDETGTKAFIPEGRNTGTWVATNEAWRFTPENDNNYKVTWYEGTDTTTQPIAYGAYTAYQPYDGLTYTARLHYDGCVDALDTKTFNLEEYVPEIAGERTIEYSSYHLFENPEKYYTYYIDPVECDSIKWELTDCYNWYIYPDPLNELFAIKILYVTPATLPSPSGTLWLTVYSKRCGVLTNHIDITTSMVGLDENEIMAKHYPNPTTGIFYVETELQGSAEVVVYNTEGKQVLIQTTEGGTIAIDLGNQPAGLYYYAITNNQKRLSGKVLKK